MQEVISMTPQMYPSSSNANFVKKFVSKDFFKDLARQVDDEELDPLEAKVALQEELIKNVGQELAKCQASYASLKQEFTDQTNKHTEDLRQLRDDMTQIMRENISTAVREALRADRQDTARAQPPIAASTSSTAASNLPIVPTKSNERTPGAKTLVAAGGILGGVGGGAVGGATIGGVPGMIIGSVVGGLVGSKGVGYIMDSIA